MSYNDESRSYGGSADTEEARQVESVQGSPVITESSFIIHNKTSKQNTQCLARDQINIVDDDKTPILAKGQAINNILLKPNVKAYLQCQYPYPLIQ